LLSNSTDRRVIGRKFDQFFYVAVVFSGSAKFVNNVLIGPCNILAR
jgi:hypothetical protein